MVARGCYINKNKTKNKQRKTYWAEKVICLYLRPKSKSKISLHMLHGVHRHYN